MGLKQLICVDMEPQAVPEIYLCPKIGEGRLMAEAVRYVKVGAEPSPEQVADGAQITVAPGQCLFLISGGKIKEVCAAPGVYQYQEQSPASFLMGSLTRFGAPDEEVCGSAERAIYLNTEEFGNNEFQLGQKVPFRSDDGQPVSLMCRGRYCYRIANPILFFNYIQPRFGLDADRTVIDQWLKEQFLSVVPLVFERLAAMGVTDTTLGEHTPEMMSTFRAMLYDKWYTTGGIELQRVSVTTVAMHNGGFNPFDSTTVQAEQDESTPDAQLERAAKEFLGSVLSAFGAAFNATTEEKNASE